MGTIVFTRHPAQEMRAKRQWVCWRYELIDNKWKKPPYDPRTGRRADTTKPQQWSTYKEAAQTCLHGGYDGIGYVFQVHEGYIRIDFDNCRNPETGQIDKWAMEIVAYLNSYTEISPSGDGLHIIVKGRLRGRNRSVDKLGAHQLGKLEMYANSTQYFTWTNNYLDGTPENIEERSREAEELYDIAFWEQLAGERKSARSRGVGQPPPIVRQDEPRTPAQEQADNWLLNRARTAKNGATFRRLYDELPASGSSQHEDDFRLCLLLLYWTQNEQGIPDLSWADRLFRHSTRFADRWQKWDRRLGQYTYGEVTLYKAWSNRYIQNQLPIKSELQPGHQEGGRA